MAKDKDRSVNPATAHLKSEKQKALKKGKAAVTQARTARLATRDPSRLERQISDLKAIQASSPDGLKPKEKRQLEELERDIARVKKARDALGVKDQPRARSDRRDDRGYGHGGQDGRDTVLGKRSRGWDQNEASSSDTDREVRDIPMPRDTPPPIPRPRNKDPIPKTRNANMEPLGDNVRIPHSLPARPDTASLPDTASEPLPAPQVKRTYEAAPQIRDLRKEAIKIVPTSVRQKMEASKGGGPGGRLLEEEDMQKLEAEGYGIKSRRKSSAEAEQASEGEEMAGTERRTNHGSTITKNDSEAQAQAGDPAPSLEEEEARFVKEVQMEEVSDEDA